MRSLVRGKASLELKDNNRVAQSAQGKVGVWLIGAWGGVSTTVAVGLAALQKGLSPQNGLVSSLPQFTGLELVDWDSLVIGGHEIRQLSFLESAQILRQKSGVFDESTLRAIESTLAEFDANVRTGTLINVGATIESLAAGTAKSNAGEGPASSIQRISGDLSEFRKSNGLRHVVVVNLASTEPPMDLQSLPASWDELSGILQETETSPIPASSLYAIAAMQSGCGYVNFTPSVGSNLPALWRNGRASCIPDVTGRPEKRCSRACWRRCLPPEI